MLSLRLLFAYELTLHVSAFWLSSSDAAFSWRIFGYILQVNVLGLAGLIVVTLAATAFGLKARPSISVGAATGVGIR